MKATTERGIALPLAVLTLLIVVSLTLAVGALSAPEPVIASNHLLAAQALAAAESGLEAARVALSSPHALATRFAPTLAEAPLTRIPGTSAGYRIAMSVDGAWTVFEKANQRRVVVTGVAAGGEVVDLDAAANRALRTVEATLRRASLLNTLFVPAAALLAGGGSLKAEIDARQEATPGIDGWCARAGESAMPLAGAVADGAHALDNRGLVWGPGDDVPNEPGRDVRHRDAAPPPDFLLANHAFTPEELAALKALAISTGTFHRASPLVFAAHAPLPAQGSVVYVEGDIEIEAYGTDTVWSGWLIAVAPAGPGSGGRIAVRCLPPCAPAWRRLTVDGLLYADDRFEVDTAGANRLFTVNGAVIARNLGGISSRVAPERAADVRLRLRCQGDGASQRGVRDAIIGTPETTGVFDPRARSGWFLKSGSYREIAGQS